MFKQKVSRVLAAFMTLALVVSVMPQGTLNGLVPSAQANLMSPASHSPDSCSDGQNKSKSGSINGSLEPTNTFKVTLSGGVGEVVSIFLPGKGTTNFPADTTVATVSDVSSSGSWVVTYKCEGTGSGSALVNFDSATYNLTSSWTWTTSVASNPTFTGTTLSPSTGSYSATLNPHDINVQVVCNLNGGTFTSMSASGSDVASSGSVSGSGTTRTLTFPVRNTLLAPSLKSNIDVTCTTSVGVVTNTDFTFEFVNNPPPATAVNDTDTHSNSGTKNFDMPVSSTDVNGNQVTISLSGCSGQWSLLGTGTNPGTPTATDTVRFTANQDQFGTFTCNVQYQDNLGASATAVATANVTDDETTVTINPTDLSAVSLGADQVVTVSFNDPDDANQTDVITIVSSDPDIEVYFDDQTTPFTSELITYDGAGDDNFDFYILTDPLYPGGGFVTIGSNGSKFANKDFDVGPLLGGSRLRDELGSPIIKEQGGLDYTKGISLEYKTSFESDLKLSAAYDSTTQVRACWKVAVGADGKEIPGVPRVSTSASTGGTETASGTSDSGTDLTLGYDWKPDFGFDLGGKYAPDVGVDFTEDAFPYLSGLKYDGFGVGYGLGGFSIGITYGSGDDIRVIDDEPQEIPYTDYDDNGDEWKIGAGFDLGVGLKWKLDFGYTGDTAVDEYPANSPTGSYSQGGAYGGTYNF